VVSRSSELHSHTHRMPALDGVRGLAILLVLGAHTHDPQLLPSGMVGVDLFFVLSGFLITSILLDESRRTGTIHLGRFYLRRFLRLYPALVVVLLFTIVYSSVVDPPEVFQRTLADAWRVMFYYYNWHLVWPIPHLATSFMHLHLWSLSIEEQFYLVWPALLLLLLWWHASKRVTWGMLAVAVIAPALARIAVWHLYDPAEWWGRFRSIWIYFRTDLRIDALMWGAALAWLLYQGYKPGNRMRAAVAWGSVAAFAGLIVYASFHSFMNGIFHRGGMSLVGFLSALLLAGAIWCRPLPLRLLLEAAPLRWTGRVSYGVYLWNIPFFVMASDLPLLGWQQAIVMLAATFPVASLSYYVMERPILRLKDQTGLPLSGRMNGQFAIPATATAPRH
jgi:peptidoglycan/LPS O-acetylase OafA/YrhL